jgi:hypothetical protein
MRCHGGCPREHHIRYDLGYRPLVEPAVFRFGSLMHSGLESWSVPPDPEAPDGQLSAAIDTMRRVHTSANSIRDFSPEKELAMVYELVKAEELMRGYHYRWFDDATIFLEVEKQFETDLINPETGAASRTYRLGGKIDGIAEVVEGHPSRIPGIYVVERKTTSDDIGLGSDYWRQLRLDAQVSTYFVGAQSLGHDVIGCIYDVIRKPGIRPSAVPLRDEDGLKIVLDAAGQRVRTKDGKKWRETGDAEQGYVLQTRSETPEEYRARLREDIAANPDKYYQRGTVVRLEDEMRDAAFDAWETAKTIADGRRLGRNPRKSWACRRWGSMCGFFDVCTGAASLEDETRFRKLDNVHEELSL